MNLRRDDSDPQWYGPSRQPDCPPGCGDTEYCGFAHVYHCPNNAVNRFWETGRQTPDSVNQVYWDKLVKAAEMKLVDKMLIGTPDKHAIRWAQRVIENYQRLLATLRREANEHPLRIGTISAKQIETLQRELGGPSS